MTQLEGILAVHKPAGWTSHDVVAKVRGMVRLKRIGHTGTLDPEVTGVLPLCLGRATRVVEYLQELPKEYHAVLRLGYSTDTEDITGNVVETADEVRVTRDEALEALQSLEARSLRFLLCTPPSKSTANDCTSLPEKARRWSAKAVP